MSGLFIVFEGVDGVGKTTAIKEIQKRIYQKFPKLKTSITSEFNHTNVSQLCHKLLINDSTDSLVKTYLVAAARTENIQKNIKPKLQDGYIVISDRFVESSLIYQGVIGKVGLEKVKEINKYAIDNCFPNIVFILNASLRKILENIENRKKEAKNQKKIQIDDHLSEKEKQEVISCYVNMFLKEKFKSTDTEYYLINANFQINKVVDEIWKILKKKIVEVNK